ncbi:hypothetical protein [Nocardia sp. NPDC019395]|uniref:hypothetical protein n=1 Tax=Nocardia sp. NPDC019395 TaxID=3154686 RepID=UPI0033F4DA2E
MTTPNPRPNNPGAARPGVPLPGQHLPGASEQSEPADPERIRADVRELLAELATGPIGDGAAGNDTAGTDLARRAHILEQAHDVLVQALATVDKI